jgi:arylsulfatase A-like enzyme
MPPIRSTAVSPAASGVPPATTRANAAHGALAGILIASTYAVLEILASGPLSMGSDTFVGSWYIGAVFTYAAVYAALGGLTGLVVGFALGRAGGGRHHTLPTLSALLLLAFTANAWAFGEWSGALLVSGVLLPVALWLLWGLRSPAEDPARVFVGSPWPTALVTLIPLGLSEAGSVDFGSLATVGAAVLIAVAVAALALRSRSRGVHIGPGAWKRQALTTAALLLICFAALRMMSIQNVAAQTRPRPPDRPSIVLITLDTTRADRLSVYGYRHRTTPRLEAFASRATLYRHAYANGDMTLSSHGSMFTGLYPTQHGAHLEHSRRSAVAATVPVLGELLRKAGYLNYASIANNVFLDPVYGFARGFDEWHLPRPLAVVSPDRGTYLLRRGVYKLTLPWLWTGALRQYMPAAEIATAGETLLGELEGEPFFLFLNFMESHRPWVSSGQFRALFPGYEQTFDELEMRSLEPAVVAGRRTVTAPEMAKMGAAYDGSSAYLDDVVGRLLERFAREPWYEKSLIIVTADHGEHLGEKNKIDHGNGVDAPLTSIPMIVKFPGQTAGREVQSPVSQVDIFSTVAAAAGVVPPGPRAGVDLAAGDPGEERSIIIESFPQNNFIRDNPKMDRSERALVKGRWKLIASTTGRRELYDMVSDPTESTERSADQPEVARELEALLRDWTVAAERQRPKANPLKRDNDLLQRMKALGYLQ